MSLTKYKTSLVCPVCAEQKWDIKKRKRKYTLKCQTCGTTTVVTKEYVCPSK